MSLKVAETEQKVTSHSETGSGFARGTRVTFIVNGGPKSPMADRARAFSHLLGDAYEISIVYRNGNKIGAIREMLRSLRSHRPGVVYVFDIGYSGVLAALLYRVIGCTRVVVETGDAITALARSSGMRSAPGIALTWLLENLALYASDAVVVRGTFHQTLLRNKRIAADVIPDGVDTSVFRPLNAGSLRQRHGLEHSLTIGFVGSCVWSEKLQMCYGWELVEAVRLLKDKPIRGVVIGDGTGLSRLKAACAQYGIEDKVLFLGRVPFESLPEYLNLIDICLSTQTNDIPGQVRTTGKLPLYLGCGRYILATKVGEAAAVLDESMLIAYTGVKDPTYPAKLAERIEDLLANPEPIFDTEARTLIAKTRFEYRELVSKVDAVIRRQLR